MCIIIWLHNQLTYLTITLRPWSTKEYFEPYLFLSPVSISISSLLIVIDAILQLVEGNSSSFLRLGAVEPSEAPVLDMACVHIEFERFLSAKVFTYSDIQRDSEFYNPRWQCWFIWSSQLIDRCLGITSRRDCSAGLPNLSPKYLVWVCWRCLQPITFFFLLHRCSTVYGNLNRYIYYWKSHKQRLYLAWWIINLHEQC